MPYSFKLTLFFVWFYDWHSTVEGFRFPANPTRWPGQNRTPAYLRQEACQSVPCKHKLPTLLRRDHSSSVNTTSLARGRGRVPRCLPGLSINVRLLSPYFSPRGHHCLQVPMETHLHIDTWDNNQYICSFVIKFLVPVYSQGRSLRSLDSETYSYRCTVKQVYVNTLRYRKNKMRSTLT